MTRDVADGHGRPGPSRDPHCQDCHSEATRTRPILGRSALHRPPDCTRRVPGPAVVLDCTAPSDSPEIDLTIEILPGDEVSRFLHEAVEVGDMLEVRGPIGGHFAWYRQPALGVAGGSGIVPVMSMLRHARMLGQPDLFHLVVSVRRPEELYYAAEVQGPDATIVFTRAAPDGHVRPSGRLVAEDLASAMAEERDVYVCGSTAFCDAATRLIASAGVPSERIKVERFGFSG